MVLDATRIISFWPCILMQQSQGWVRTKWSEKRGYSTTSVLPSSTLWEILNKVKDQSYRVLSSLSFSFGYGRQNSCSHFTFPKVAFWILARVADITSWALRGIIIGVRVVWMHPLERHLPTLSMSSAKTVAWNEMNRFSLLMFMFLLSSYISNSGFSMGMHLGTSARSLLSFVVVVAIYDAGFSHLDLHGATDIVVAPLFCWLTESIICKLMVKTIYNLPKYMWQKWKAYLYKNVASVFGMYLFTEIIMDRR